MEPRSSIEKAALFNDPPLFPDPEGVLIVLLSVLLLRNPGGKKPNMLIF